ncbi:MAG: hypothetical protein H6621_07030 [Halobacteriovoraceae bacterium]|nr:hypothetical protein [Halobacteriovoraceae bacterium]
MKTLLISIFLTTTQFAFADTLMKNLTIEIMNKYDKLYGSEKCSGITNRGEVLDSISTVSDDGNEIIYINSQKTNVKKYLKHIGAMIDSCWDTDSDNLRNISYIKKAAEAISKKDYQDMKDDNVFDAFLK